MMVVSDVVTGKENAFAVFVFVSIFNVTLEK
jgi:hypothetical protein